MEYSEVALCFDDNYADKALVTAYSVLTNSEFVCLHIIYCGKNATKVKADFEKLKNAFDWKHVLVSFTEFAVPKDVSYDSTLSSAASARLFMPKLLYTQKVIYIDCDTIVIDDISKLFNKDMGTKSIALCKDYDVALYSKSIEQIGFDSFYKKLCYYNDGVMLLKLNDTVTSIFNKAVSLLKANNFRYGEQDAINVALLDMEHVVMPLEYEWNYRNETGEFWGHSLQNAKIVHFTMQRDKPWNVNNKNKNSIFYNKWREYKTLTDAIVK